MISKYILIGLLTLIFGLFIKYRFFTKKYDDYDRLYNEILYSDKYKVKGQYD